MVLPHGPCHALMPALRRGANVSQYAPLTFLCTIRMRVGADTVARMQLDPEGHWDNEAGAVRQTGIVTVSWVATDHIATREDRQSEVGHVVGKA